MWLDFCNLVIKLNGWSIASYGWSMKMVSWDASYSWRRCCEDCRNDNKRYSTYYINLVDKTVAAFENIDSNFKRSPAVDKILLNSTECCREIVMKGRVHLCIKLQSCFILRHCHSHPKLQQATLDQSAAINIEARPSTSKKDYNSLKGQMMARVFWQ